MRGHVLERYNRFLVDIRTRDDRVITAYCPATGRLTSCFREEAPVEYVPVTREDRSLDYDWWSIKMPTSWVVIDTRPANRWLYWSRRASWLPTAWKQGTWTAEPSLPKEGRLDFRVDGPHERRTWIEVKSVTWCEEGVGYFPDAPTQRGTRHVRTLTRLGREQESVDRFVVFVCMRSDIEVIRPAASLDPDFTEAIREARAAGVRLLGVAAEVTDRSLRLTGRIPVQLEESSSSG